MDMNLKAEDIDRADDTVTVGQESASGADQPESPREAEPKVKVMRERSQIAFPWYDLDTAIDVARSIHEAGGMGISRDQLGGLLNISPSAGNFSIKVGAARMYGLVEVVQSKFQLTQLGYSALSKDDNAARAAKAEAFLKVPLYRRAYDEFRGKPLPPRPTGLENAFVSFGVPAKSKSAARQVFDRSARQSGFSTVDPDRLIEPMIATSVGSDRPTVDATDERPATAPFSNSTHVHGGSEIISLELDELVRGLLKRLPKAGDKWTPEAKAKWLRALSQNLDFVCDVEGDKVVVIEVRSE